ncbi:hypothetical protein O1611_g2749 [Lasiodiplodia mahajangana]|uniref:Uncharacterized protein n=1 Tax=Lasiodiplodia mahajangana TaxID=1108764 RepID=A0ACC2JTP9_9PEZI|nr:hypothetical protein O1611_g2749 [Lasiodiplodia mahajangana]
MAGSWRSDSKRREEGRRIKGRASSTPPTSRELTAYRYRPLPSGSIRLLQIMPHRDEYAPIQCHLVDYFLLDPDSGKQPHLYEALSYVWGSPEKTRLVYLETGYLAITENLHAALSRLRNRTFPRVIWADAICINQDDERERGFQVQLMAVIYAKATCVLVWLEEAIGRSRSSREETITDGDRALEEICAAVEGQSPGWVDDATRKVIVTLLNRSWFRRIWVLQEVSAARQISIMTRSLEMDGFAFYSGLKALNFSCEDSEMQCRIGSALYLIRDANLRSKTVTPHSDKFSLDISTLGQLIDMYHNREATDSRDKVYALLGMSNDGHSVGGLSPNYEISWKHLFRQFVNFIVGPNGLVETRGEEQAIAVIKTWGHVIGRVADLRGIDAWENRQRVKVEQTSVFKYLTSQLFESEWTLRATAKLIRPDDLVCILQGASHPTIIRAYEDYCAVIAIATTPTVRLGKGTKVLSSELLELVQSNPGFQYDLFLVWDLESPWNEPQVGADYKTFLQSRMPDELGELLEDSLDRATRLHTIGRILVGIQDGLASTAFRKAIMIYGEIPGKKDPRISRLLEPPPNDFHDAKGSSDLRRLGIMADICAGKKYWFSTDIRYWTPVGWRMDNISAIAQTYDHRLMAFLLDEWGNEITITEEVVKAAAENFLWAREMIGLLLDRRGEQVIITEEVLKAAAESRYHAREVLALLFDRGNGRIIITEEVLKAAARNPRYPKEVLTLLIDQADEQSPITEEVLKEAVGNRRCPKELLDLLATRGHDRALITEEAKKIPTIRSISKTYWDSLVGKGR